MLLQLLIIKQKHLNKKKKETKKQEILELFQKHELNNYLSFDSIFQDSYLNKTITLQKLVMILIQKLVKSKMI